MQFFVQPIAVVEGPPNAAKTTSKLKNILKNFNLGTLISTVCGNAKNEN